MLHFRFIALAAALSLAASAALAQEFKAGDISIDHAWARATPKGAAVGAGYLVIHNHGAAADKLTGGSADFAGGVAVHEMTMVNGVSRMREMKGGLNVPANGEVALAPNGYHLMFTGLKQPLKKGETVKVTLNFEHAGQIAVELPVAGVGAASPGGAMKGMDMKGMKM
jgi:periplasmic copper chaperone A